MFGKVIGFGGLAGSGKNTACDYLVEQYGYIEVSFARNLKEMCKHVFGLSSDEVYGEISKNKSFEEPVVLSYAHLMGIDFWVRNINQGVFVSNSGFRHAFSRYVSEGATLLKSPREILQFVGTEILRKYYSPSFHIDVLQKNMQQLQIDHEELINFCISDARFVNERTYSKKSWGGVNVRIEGPGDAKKRTTGLYGHASEREILQGPYDFTILNEKKGLLPLHSELDKIVKSL